MSHQTKTPAAGRGEEGARVRAGLRARVVYTVLSRLARGAAAATVGALAGAALAEIAAAIWERLA